MQALTLLQIKHSTGCSRMLAEIVFEGSNIGIYYLVLRQSLEFNFPLKACE